MCLQMIRQPLTYEDRWWLMRPEHTENKRRMPRPLREYRFERLKYWKLPIHRFRSLCYSSHQRKPVNYCWCSECLANKTVTLSPWLLSNELRKLENVDLSRVLFFFCTFNVCWFFLGLVWLVYLLMVRDLLSSMSYYEEKPIGGRTTVTREKK